jgi:tungstate transport system ATP-binding protein
MRPLDGTTRRVSGAPLSAPLISLTGVSVRFGTVTALRHVDLAVRPGEFIALVGANGSGKTSLLRALHGMLPHEGVRTVRAMPQRPLVQAMVFQRPFVMRLSVLNNLRLALWLAGVRRVERLPRATQALQRVGLLAVADRPAQTLSAGQQQRLALARAWAVRPDVLFLDEPTASLDPSAKREVETLLQGFAAEGMTLVMSTHNLGQAKRLVSRVIYLEAGAVKVDLPTHEFFNAALAGDADLFLKGELSWNLQ